MVPGWLENKPLGSRSRCAYQATVAEQVARNPHSTPRKTAPEQDQLGPLDREEQCLKASMYSHSRRAQQNSFARRRADMVFSSSRKDPDQKGRSLIHEALDVSPDDTRSMRQRVTAGILGFIPAVGNRSTEC